MHEVVGVVDVELDGLRRRRVAAAEQIDETDADPVQRLDVSEVLQPRDRRLARNIVAAFGRAVAGDQQRGIVTQRIEIVAILVARRDRHHARRDHCRIGVRDEQRIARVGERPGDHIGHAQPQRRLTQHDQAAVRCEIAGVQRGCERLAGDG